MYRKIFLALFSFFLFTSNLCAKDVEITIYKNLLRKFINNVFPIVIEENLAPSSSDLANIMPLGYRLEFRDPVPIIQSNYIQVDISVDFTSILGKHTFPATCKFMPVYNEQKNCIELKVIEGNINLNINTEKMKIDLGTFDLSSYINEIKIPLQVNDFNVKNNTVSTKIKNVKLFLLPDRIIADSNVEFEKK